MKRHLVTLLVAVCVSSTAMAIETKTITSSNFSLGYGFLFTWNNSETSGANTPTVQGDFSFTPALSGTTNSGSGVAFPNRVLTDGPTQHSAQTNNFAVSITSNWTGATPGDALPTPNYRLQLNITSLRVWATDFDATPTNDLAWQETTVGHTGSSAPVALIAGWPNWGSTSVYTQIIWDPADFEVTGTTSTRTFAMLPNSTAGNPALDGFEVFGNVQLIYDAVPEPASLGLLGLGGLVTMWRRPRRR